MTQREVALERLYEEVGRVLKRPEHHMPFNIAQAWLNVSHLSRDDQTCEVCGASSTNPAPILGP